MALGAYMAWDTVKNLALDYYFPKDLSGQVAVITGAGSGIGRGIAVSLAKIGVKVALWDLNVAGMEETMRMVKEVGGEGAIYKVNVCDKEVRMVKNKCSRERRGNSRTKRNLTSPPLAPPRRPHSLSTRRPKRSPQTSGTVPS